MSKLEFIVEKTCIFLLVFLFYTHVFAIFGFPIYEYFFSPWEHWYTRLLTKIGILVIKLVFYSLAGIIGGIGASSLGRQLNPQLRQLDEINKKPSMEKLRNVQNKIILYLSPLIFGLGILWFLRIYVFWESYVFWTLCLSATFVSLCIFAETYYSAFNVRSYFIFNYAATMAVWELGIQAFHFIQGY